MAVPQTIARMIVLYNRFVPSEALLIINLDEKLSTKICIYSYLTSCILCSFDLNRLDR